MVRRCRETPLLIEPLLVNRQQAEVLEVMGLGSPKYRKTDSFHYWDVLYDFRMTFAIPSRPLVPQISRIYSSAPLRVTITP